MGWPMGWTIRWDGRDDGLGEAKQCTGRGVQTGRTTRRVLLERSGSMAGVDVEGKSRVNIGGGAWKGVGVAKRSGEGEAP